MLREDAIEQLQDLKCHCSDMARRLENPCNAWTKDVEALDFAIATLEQEPKTDSDCISRQSVIDMTGLSEWFDTSDSYNDFVIALSELPCVKSEQKTGHWIKVTNGRGGHECDICQHYAPSFQSGEEHLSKYCPNCGARMSEVSEDGSN